MLHTLLLDCWVFSAAAGLKLGDGTAEGVAGDKDVDDH